MQSERGFICSGEVTQQHGRESMDPRASEGSSNGGLSELPGLSYLWLSDVGQSFVGKQCRQSLNV